MKLQLKSKEQEFSIPAPETENHTKLLDWAHDMAVIYAEAIGIHSTAFDGKFILEPYEINMLKKCVLCGEIGINTPNANIAQIIALDYHPAASSGRIKGRARIEDINGEFCGISYVLNFKHEELYTKLFALGELSDNWQITIPYV